MVHELPLLPFMSILLGLMSIMALTTMGISVEQRKEKTDQVEVELVGIPANFVPINIRCTEDWLMWHDGLAWRKVNSTTLLSLLSQGPSQIGLDDDLRGFLQFMVRKTHQNKQLSYQRKQHTIIYWVEPAGISTYAIADLIIAELQLPMRTGLLPIKPNEVLTIDGKVSPQN
jgi:hypothetical protein